MKKLILIAAAVLAVTSLHAQKLVIKGSDTLGPILMDPLSTYMEFDQAFSCARGYT